MIPTVTFVPGTMCDQRIWGPVWRELGPQFDLAYLPIETRLTRDGMRELFREAGAKAPLNLVAFSMGGYLAIQHALDHPRQVASLMTIGSSAFGLAPAELAERRRTIEWLSLHTYRGIPTGRLNTFIHPSRRGDPAIIDVMKTMDRDLGQEVLMAQMKETSERVSLAPRLGDITCPTLLIGGDSDPYLPPGSLGAMAAAIPHARTQVAADTGHLIPLEQPQWLAAQISGFHAHAA